MSHPGLANLWRPDTHIVNAKSSHRPETVTKLRSSGQVSIHALPIAESSFQTFVPQVEQRTRLFSVVSCPMDLRLFPMDRQVCSLVFQSSAHINKELTYKWKYGNRSRLPFVQGLDYQDRMTPDMRLLGYRFREAKSVPDEVTHQAFDQVLFSYLYYSQANASFNKILALPGNCGHLS